MRRIVRSLVNSLAARRFPTPDALELTVRQRQGYHASWDWPVTETMAAFYRRHPEWASSDVPKDDYSNAWYYAMQQRGDDEAAGGLKQYFYPIIFKRLTVSEATGPAHRATPIAMTGHGVLRRMHWRRWR